MTLWVMTTNDDLELPIGVEGSEAAMAKRLGITISSLQRRELYWRQRKKYPTKDTKLWAEYRIYKVVCDD